MSVDSAVARRTLAPISQGAIDKAWPADGLSSAQSDRWAWLKRYRRGASSSPDSVLSAGSDANAARTPSVAGSAPDVASASGAPPPPNRPTATGPDGEPDPAEEAGRREQAGRQLEAIISAPPEARQTLIPGWNLLVRDQPPRSTATRQLATQETAYGRVLEILRLVNATPEQVTDLAVSERIRDRLREDLFPPPAPTESDPTSTPDSTTGVPATESIVAAALPAGPLRPGYSLADLARQTREAPGNRDLVFGGVIEPPGPPEPPSWLSPLQRLRYMHQQYQQRRQRLAVTGQAPATEEVATTPAVTAEPVSELGTPVAAPEPSHQPPDAGEEIASRRERIWPSGETMVVSDRAIVEQALAITKLEGLIQYSWPRDSGPYGAPLSRTRAARVFVDYVTDSRLDLNSELGRIFMERLATFPETARDAIWWCLSSRVATEPSVEAQRPDRGTAQNPEGLTEADLAESGWLANIRTFITAHPDLTGGLHDADGRPVAWGTRSEPAQPGTGRTEEIDAINWPRSEVTGSLKLLLSGGGDRHPDVIVVDGVTGRLNSPGKDSLLSELLGELRVGMGAKSRAELLRRTTPSGKPVIHLEGGKLTIVLHEPVDLGPIEVATLTDNAVLTAEVKRLLEGGAHQIVVSGLAGSVVGFDRDAVRISREVAAQLGLKNTAELKGRTLASGVLTIPIPGRQSPDTIPPAPQPERTIDLTQTIEVAGTQDQLRSEAVRIAAAIRAGGSSDAFIRLRGSKADLDTIRALLKDAGFAPVGSPPERAIPGSDSLSFAATFAPVVPEVITPPPAEPVTVPSDDEPAVPATAPVTAAPPPPEPVVVAPPVPPPTAPTTPEPSAPPVETRTPAEIALAEVRISLESTTATPAGLFGLARRAVEAGALQDPGTAELQAEAQRVLEGTRLVGVIDYVSSEVHRAAEIAKGGSRDEVQQILQALVDAGDLLKLGDIEDPRNYLKRLFNSTTFNDLRSRRTR